MDDDIRVEEISEPYGDEVSRTVLTNDNPAESMVDIYLLKSDGTIFFADSSIDVEKVVVFTKVAAESTATAD